MLLESLLKEAWKRGAGTLFLEVSESNHAAQNLMINSVSNVSVSGNVITQMGPLRWC